LSTAPSTTPSGAYLPDTSSVHDAPDPLIAQPKTEAPASVKTLTNEPASNQAAETTDVLPTPTASPLTAANLEQHDTSVKASSHAKPLTLPEALHLSRDTVLAVATAMNLRRKKRTHLSIEDLLSSMKTELAHQALLKDKYSFQTTTPLDHPIALSRELLATHDTEKLAQWLDSSHPHVHQTNGCIFSFTRLSPLTKSQPQTKRLDNYLLLFARSCLQRLDNNKEVKKQTTNAIRSLLLDRKLDTAYDWLSKAPIEKLYLDDESLLTQERLRSSPISNKHEKTTLKLKETQPPISEAVSKLLKDQLPNIVSKTITDAETTLKDLPTGKYPPDTITQLTTHIVRHNPRWNTPIFGVTTHMTVQATKSLSLQPPTFEVLLLTHGMNAILNKLRDSQPQN